MTPENDVNKESDQNNTEADASAAGDHSADQAENVTKLNEQASATGGANATDSANASSEALEGEVVADSSDAAATASEGAEDDIDRAASAQVEQTAQAANGVDSDDPLGFGDTRMEGEAEDGDNVLPLEGKLTEAEAKVASQADQLVRMQAEMENQRKRAQNDVTKAHKFALEKIALDLLPVRDSLEMGLQAATGEDADPAKIVEGSELTLKMLTQALEKYNIVEINPLDEKFDPEFHQAMSMQPVEGKEPNTVSGVMQKGYTLNDRLIRPALVMVAK